MGVVFFYITVNLIQFCAFVGLNYSNCVCTFVRVNVYIYIYIHTHTQVEALKFCYLYITVLEVVLVGHNY